ncbi:MAG: hypothetical protein CMH83_22930 [Nocardioides sp.]|nr:hypothetical protein [Nocardioides sp.]
MDATRRARAALGLAALLLPAALLSACADDAVPSAGDPAPSDATSSTADKPSGSATTGSDTATPEDAGEAEPDLSDTVEYAVDPPGPRSGALVPADLLVQDADEVPQATVRALRDVAGVRTVSRLSLGQVSLENKVYTIAAVDPGEYRRFTELASAELQDQWDRVAGGELAVDPDVRKKLPVSKAGWLKLGVDETRTRVHVGAYAPQVEGIDLVVNEKVGAALGLTMHNAVIVSAGRRDPASLREPIESVIGDRPAVQALDAVARYGLDPDAVQNVVLVGSRAEAVGVFRFTPIGGGRVQPEASWVSAHIATETMPIIGRMTCNKAVFPQLRAALEEIVLAGLSSKIHPGEYAGCYYPRFIAGTTTLSNHSFGLAFDINVPGNGRGTVGEIDRKVVAIFKKWGFGWGGDWSYTDPMHFELDTIVRPG